MIYGSMWAHMGPYGWPEVKQKQRGQVQLIISDGDFFLGLCPGDVGRHDQILGENST